MRRSVRESSFNMASGGGEEDIEGGLRKFLDTQKGGSEKNRGGLRKLVLVVFTSRK